MSAQPPTILVVDDEPAHRESLGKILEREGWKVVLAESSPHALDLCGSEPIDVLVTDLMMPTMSGIELIRTLRNRGSDVEAIVMTAFGTIETAVEAMREGAYDFVEKPLKRMQITKAVRKAIERRTLLAENKTLREEISQLKEQSSVRPRGMIGESAAFRRARDLAEQAAVTSATVLILGESGTGKELLARHVHERSGRKGAFVGLNLAALPETLVEAELFGYERGSFTGAIQRREGRIATAQNGTLFLDEVGELSPQVQVKLLRVLQEGEFEPLGGKTQLASFRLIAATNRNLTEDVAAGRFREDLFYRLNVIAISCPRLSERPEDVPLLVDHFLGYYAKKHQRTRASLSAEAHERLRSYRFPGNVRELENAIERAVVLGRGPVIEITDLPESIASTSPQPESLSFPMGTPLDEIERRTIRATLQHTGGDKQAAADILRISARTIYRKLDEVHRLSAVSDDD